MGTQVPLKLSPAPWISLCTADSTWWLQPILIEGTYGVPNLGDQGGCEFGPCRTLYQVWEGDVAALPNTQKQTQGDRQNEETKKYA